MPRNNLRRPTRVLMTFQNPIVSGLLLSAGVRTRATGHARASLAYLNAPMRHADSMLLRQVASRLAAAGLPLTDPNGGGGGGGGRAGPSSPTRAVRVPVKDHLRKLFQGAHQTLCAYQWRTVLGAPQLLLHEAVLCVLSDHAAYPAREMCRRAQGNQVPEDNPGRPVVTSSLPDGRQIWRRWATCSGA